MKLIRVTLRSINGSSFLSRQCHRPWMAKALFTSSTSGNEINDNGTGNSFESADDFERRIFSGFSDSRSNNDAFFQKLDRLEKAHGRSGFGSKGGSNNSEFFDGLDESFNTLSDGMDGKLKKAATYFEFNPDEITGDDYSFRADVTFRPGMTYDVKDLDLTRPGVPKPFKRSQFETTTEEVLRKADFRNVRFLANFLTEAGLIIKRSKTKISAKAQRKVAREIKTARALGLMPFTTMGTKPFIFGKTMEDRDEDDEYDYYDSPVGGLGASQDPVEE